MASNRSLCNETHIQHRAHGYRGFPVGLPAAIGGNRRRARPIPAGRDVPRNQTESAQLTRFRAMWPRVPFAYCTTQPEAGPCSGNAFARASAIALPLAA